VTGLWAGQPGFDFRQKRKFFSPSQRADRLRSSYSIRGVLFSRVKPWRLIKHRNHFTFIIVSCAYRQIIEFSTFIVGSARRHTLARLLIASNDMKIFGYFRQNHSLLLGHFFDTRKCLNRCVYEYLVWRSLDFYCFLLYVIILSSFADSEIGFFSS
jgi:hypothetical protein